MKQFYTVFKFEISNFIKNKTFVAATLIMVLLVFFGIFGFSKYVENKEKKLMNTDKVEVEQTIVISDPGNKYKEIAETLTKASGGAAQFRTENLSESEIKKQVKDKKYDAGIIFKDNLNYKYIVNSLSITDKNTYIVDEALKVVAQSNYLAAKNLTPEEIQGFFVAKPEVELEVLSNNQKNTFAFTYLMMMLFYFMVILYGQMVSQSVVGEKSSRAMELLITSAKTENLMFGKVFGIGFVGFIQFLSIIGTGLLSIKLFTDNIDNAFLNSVFEISPKALVFSLVCFVTGFYIFAFMYAAVGAIADKIEDLTTLTYPITLMFIAIFMIIMSSLGTGKPDTTLMKVLTYIPFSAPMALITRISLSDVIPAYAIAVSLAIQVVSILLIAYLSSIIYKAGVLMYGNKPSLKTIVNILKAKKIKAEKTK
ncbi:MAG: ABC transporter permease [Clostridia bacterium]|nr:ABC transporter permease [Clostridia bacterium]